MELKGKYIYIYMEGTYPVVDRYLIRGTGFIVYRFERSNSIGASSMELSIDSSRTKL